MFSEIDAVKGESKDKTHAKQTDVLSWSWAMSNNGSADVGGDAEPTRSMCRTSGSPSMCLEEICDPEAALELASTPKGLLSRGCSWRSTTGCLKRWATARRAGGSWPEDLRQQRQVSLLALSQGFASDGPRLRRSKMRWSGCGRPRTGGCGRFMG
jgi:hypothetical protein